MTAEVNARQKLASLDVQRKALESEALAIKDGV